MPVSHIPNGLPAVRLVELTVSALSVPLLEPFVISATSRIDTTRAALVRVTLEDLASGKRAEGIGEAAALPNVTREDQPELLEALSALGRTSTGTSLPDLAALGGSMRSFRADRSRAQARSAPWSMRGHAWRACRCMPCSVRDTRDTRDTRAKKVPQPQRRPPCPARSTPTSRCRSPSPRTWRARRHRARGFLFKVKVGKRLDDDCASLRAVARAVPDACFRLDANAGFSAARPRAARRARRRRAAHRMLRAAVRGGRLAGMAEVRARRRAGDRRRIVLRRRGSRALLAARAATA